MSYCLLLLLLGIQNGATEVADSGELSNLKSDERVVFFSSDARLSDDDSEWIIPIHAWVHELDDAKIRRAAITGTLRAKYGLKSSPETKANLDHRLKLIVADNERGKTIVIRLLDKTFRLPETDVNGHTRATIRLADDLVSKRSDGKRLRFEAVISEKDERRFFGSVNLISKRGISVISDFDDTVKISHVSDRKKMLNLSLYQDFEPAPGMPVLYSGWGNQGCAFHFVSSSPWHLYEPIDAFLNANGFPERSMSLKSFRLKDSSLLNLFLSGTKTKPIQIRPILNAFPKRQFVLVGDTGEHDPEVYAAMLKEFPDQIDVIMLRNVTDQKRDDERFQKLFGGIDDSKWHLFTDPADIADRLPKPRRSHDP